MIYRFEGYLIINHLVGLEFFVGVEKILFLAFLELMSVIFHFFTVSYLTSRSLGMGSPNKEINCKYIFSPEKKLFKK